MTDEELRDTFTDMVRAVELAADELSRPWRIATGLLAAMLAAAVCWRNK